MYDIFFWFRYVCVYEILLNIIEIFFFRFVRRVHITEDTLDRLDNRFEVEPGNGHLRDSYLAQHAIKTYLIIDPTVCCE